tara:strand:- start:332 stop:508 length:177 start_codon:yes stop_codon:yes gene_type:complete
MKKFIENFKKNFSDIPGKVEQTSTSEFIFLLGVLFLLPGGSFLCIAAIYIKFRNYIKF